MAGPNRTSWKPGESGNRKGRPPRNYSIAHALSVAAEQPQSVDNEGNSLTEAQLAAKWLWDVVRTGFDKRALPSGETSDKDAKLMLPVSTRDRLEALKTILSRIEPDYKLTDKNLDDDTGDEQAQRVIERLEGLSPEELAVLEKLAISKA